MLARYLVLDLRADELLEAHVRLVLHAVRVLLLVEGRVRAEEAAWYDGSIVSTPQPALLYISIGSPYGCSRWQSKMWY